MFNCTSSNAVLPSSNSTNKNKTADSVEWELILFDIFKCFRFQYETVMWMKRIPIPVVYLKKAAENPTQML